MTDSTEQARDSDQVANNATASNPGLGRAPAADVKGIGIGAIAQEISVTKDTLRVWERRYGFPRPLRSAGGERLYPQEQVSKLRLVMRLPDAGHRPSKAAPTCWRCRNYRRHPTMHRIGQALSLRSLQTAGR